MTTATNILLYSKMYPAFVDYTRVDHVLNELTPYMLHSSYQNPPSAQRIVRSDDLVVEKLNFSDKKQIPPPEIVHLPPQPAPSIQVDLPEPIRQIVDIKIQPPSIQVDLPEPVRPSTKIRTQPSVPPPPPTIFRPTPEDTLFWCVYVAKHGMQAYREIVDSRRKNREMEEKQKLAAHFHKTPAARPDKMSMVLLKELLGEISTDRKMTLRTLPLWCIFYDLARVHVLNRTNQTYVTYLHVSTTDSVSESTYLFYDQNRRNYSIFVDETPDSSAIPKEPQELPDLSTLLQVDAYNKPFKSISNYKLDELHHMMDVVSSAPVEDIHAYSNGRPKGVRRNMDQVRDCRLPEGTDKPKKSDVYQALYTHCAWKM